MYETDRRTRRRREPRTRRRDSSPEEEDNASNFPMWKTAIVLAVVVVCFAVLYPKMFQPILMQLLGGGGSSSKASDEPSFPHPAMRGKGAAPPNAAHIHAGPGGHPGMRGGGGGPAHHDQGGGGSGGKGMWGWMLPFYSFGVIGFLIYMLTKVMFKDPKKRKRMGDSYGGRTPYDMRYNARRERFEVVGAEHRYSSEEGNSDSGEEENEGHGGKMSKRQLRHLQRKLHDTETAMHKILGQLETISSGNVSPEAAENVRQTTMETLSNLQTQDDDGGDGGDALPFRDEDLLAEEEEERRRDHVAKQAFLPDLDRAINEFKNLTAAYAEQRIKEAKEKANRPNQGDLQAEAESDEHPHQIHADPYDVVHTSETEDTESESESEEEEEELEDSCNLDQNIPAEDDKEPPKEGEAKKEQASTSELEDDNDETESAQQTAGLNRQSEDEEPEEEAQTSSVFDRMEGENEAEVRDGKADGEIIRLKYEQDEQRLMADGGKATKVRQRKRRKV